MEYKKIKDICEIKKGKKVLELEVATDDSIRYIQIDDLRNNNNIKFCLPEPSYVHVNKEDLIIAWDGANAGTIGFNLEGAIGSTLAKITVLDENIFPSFLATYLRSKFEYFQRTATGATIPHISRAALENLEVPVFSLEQQKFIYSQLLKTEEIIKKRQAQITALDELTQSLFLEMFGDPTSNKNSYPIKSLPNFYENPKEAVKCGPFGSALKKDEYVTDGVPVWNMDNITKNNGFVDDPNLFVTTEKSKSLQNYNVINGDIIISRAGTVGKMCVVESKYKDSLISTNLIRLRLNENLTPEFLVYLIKIFGDRVCRMRTGNDDAFTHMNTGVLNSIEFPYPPIEEQQEFVNRLNKIKQQKMKMEQGLVNLKDLYNALLQKAFKGELFQD